MDTYYKLKSSKEQGNFKYLFTIYGLTRGTRLYIPVYHCLMSNKD